MAGVRLRASVVLPIAALLVVGWVYRAAVRVYFISDDFPNMIAIADRGPWVFLFTTISGHMQLASNAVVLVGFELWRYHALPWAVLTLATHLLNTWLLYRLAKAYAGNALLAAFAAALWGVSPLHAEMLSWFATYGHMMCLAILLYVLVKMGEVEEERRLPRLGEIAGWTFLLWVGSTAFGVGVAVAMTFPVVAGLLLPRAFLRRATAAALVSLPVLIIATFFVTRQIAIKVGTMPFSGGSIAGQAFIRLGPQWILFKHLVLVGVGGFVQGFWRKPALYPYYAVHFAIGCAVFLIGGFIASDSRGRRRMLALSVLALSAYALIALGRANVYVMWHNDLADAAKISRYHYTGAAMLAVLVVMSLSRLCAALGVPFAGMAAVVAACGISAAVGYARSDFAIDERKDCRDTAEPMLAEVERTIDRARPGAPVFIPLTPDGIVPCGLWSYDLAPGPAALFALAHPTNKVRGHSVRFIEAPDKDDVFADPEKHRRFSRLIVSEERAKKLAATLGH